jgi:hypothetical protein
VQTGAGFGLAVPQVGGTFRRDHITGDAQRDRAVDRPPTTGDLRVAALGDDLVAEVSRRLGAGVRDQGLVVVEFQFEFVTQERRDLVFDLFGFGFRSGEAQEVIVGLCRGPGYADVRADCLVR